MMPGGVFAPYLGFFGLGPGAGIRLMFVIVGVPIAAIGAIAYLNPTIRNLESDIPDAVDARRAAGEEPLIPQPT